MFQFRHGAIKTLFKLERIDVIDVFQFRHGAIKTNGFGSRA